MSLYYNKRINWGDTSDFIANFENISVCWDKMVSQNLGSFQGKYLSRSSGLSKDLSLWFTVISLICLKLLILRNFPDPYSEHSQTSKMEFFTKIISGWKPLTNFVKKLHPRCWPKLWMRLSFIVILWTVTCESGGLLLIYIVHNLTIVTRKKDSFSWGYLLIDSIFWFNLA